MKKQNDLKNQDRPFFNLPSTKLGWWAVALAFLFGLLNFINSSLLGQVGIDQEWLQAVLPVYGIFIMLCGLAAGATGLFAVIRRGERSWVVWLALVPGLFVLFLLADGFLFLN